MYHTGFPKARSFHDKFKIWSRVFCRLLVTQISLFINTCLISTAQDPKRRMALNCVLSNAFLDPSLPTESLVTVLNCFKSRNICWETSQDIKRMKNQVGLAPPSLTYPKDGLGTPSTDLSHRVPSVGINPIRQDRARPLPRPRLYSTSPGLASSGIHDTWRRLSSRQQFDDGSLSDQTESLAVTHLTKPKLEMVGSSRKVLEEVGNLKRPFRRSTARSGACTEATSEDFRGKKDKSILPSGLLSPPETHLGQTLLDEEGICNASSISSSVSSSSEERQTWQQCRHSRPKNDLNMPSMSPYVQSVPIPRTSPPKALQVAPLLPRTHKTSHGQLVVLPSRCLLVDLREGDRRAGGRGDRVLCISPKGQEVSGSRSIRITSF
jgi:hypothetical protein